MFRSQRVTRATLVETLRSLPDAVSVFVIADDAWLVVAPSGLFVLTEDQGDLGAATLRAAEWADSVRLKLSDELVWIPFVDALCVTTEATFDPNHPCLVVPHDLVVPTITGGPITIDAETLAKLALLGFPVLS